MQIFKQLRLLWSVNAVNYGALICVIFTGIVVFTSFYQLDSWIVPLILGVIAAALSESDDNFSGRLRRIVVTLCCFSFASISVELLFPYPWLFALGLAISTFGFVLLGAIGARYASIAFGSILIAIYTMLDAENSTAIWFQPTLLIAGASWYYFMSLCWSLLWPMRPVQQSLFNVFDLLSRYLTAKSELFHPRNSLDPQPYRLEQAKLNAQIVNELNHCKGLLINRSRRGVADTTKDRFLSVYFIAQDIHERISSTHYRYQEMSDHLQHSDILFRFKHLLQRQAQACQAIAHSLRLGKSFDSDSNNSEAIHDVNHSLEHIKQDQSLSSALVTQLSFLLGNLTSVSQQLTNVLNPDVNKQEDKELADYEAHNLKSMWYKIQANLTLQSPLMRHAIRLSMALLLGYGAVQLLQLQEGFWVLLTTLFVCQPNFSATRQKLVGRIIGTFVGLIAGYGLLFVFPSTLSQLFFIVVFGVAFFVARMVHYGYATAFITLLVLFCFSQLGQGIDIIVPRLIDTLIGCSIAGLCIWFIFPDWQSNKLSKVMSEAISANQTYLAQVIGQYRIGKKDTLSYRVSRRTAHNQDALVTTAINNMLIEPGRYRSCVDESYRFLALSHSILSYTSALGAHRTQLDDVHTHQLISQAHSFIHLELSELATALVDKRETKNLHEQERGEIEKRLKVWREDSPESVALVLQQLYLIFRLLPEMHSLVSKISTRTRLSTENSTNQNR